MELGCESLHMANMGILSFWPSELPSEYLGHSDKAWSKQRIRVAAGGRQAAVVAEGQLAVRRVAVRHVAMPQAVLVGEASAR